jgi:oxygen-independent coproporphyrinogen III oxidase
MNPLSKRRLSVYLHIPFCGVKCSYCAFNTYTHLDHLIDPFVSALCEEIRIVGAGAGDYDVHTVFFGGGTPSLLTPAQIARIMAALRQHFHLLDDAEISLEANPADLSVAYLHDLRALSINRLSIGMQSANETELRLFDRRHNNDAVVRAVGAARAAGFDNLNLDMIYGVPHQTLETWRATLAQFLALQPEHASLYALSLEEGTSMRTWVERGKLPQPDDDLAADMYDMATDMLGAAGYMQYEISNWAEAGRECRHNLQYWYNDDYVGLGPGAHGFAAGVRYYVIKSPIKYIERLGIDARTGLKLGGTEGTENTKGFPFTPVVEEGVLQEREDVIAETLLMGFRLTQQGISRADFVARFGNDLLDLYSDVIQRHASGGLLEISDSRVRLTERGRLLANIVLREFV